MSHRKFSKDPFGLTASFGVHQGLMDSLGKADIGLGLTAGWNKGVLQAMQKADMGLGLAAGWNKGVLQAMRKADMGVDLAAGWNKNVLQAMRKADMGVDLAAGWNKNVLQAMRKADMGLGQFGESHKKIFESMRTVDMGLGAVDGVRQAVAAAMRLEGMNIGLFDDAARAWSKSFSTLADLASERYSVGALGGAIAAVGLSGGFGFALTSAAVAAAEFLEEKSSADASVVEHARHESLLVDAVAEVNAFAQRATSGPPDDISKQVAVALDAVTSKLADRIASARPVERVSLMNILALVVAVISAIAGIYYGQVAKDAAESGTKDSVELRSTISHANEQQINELKSLRASVEKLAEGVSSSSANESDGLWVVERAVAVFSAKSTKSAKVSELYPNQVVTAIQVQHKWVQVEYYDYVNDTLKRGWTMKKYMHPLKGKKRPVSWVQP